MSNAFNAYGMPNGNYAQPAKPSTPAASPNPITQALAPPGSTVTPQGHPNPHYQMPSDALLGMLQGGTMNPSQATDQLNQQYPGAAALYYPNNNTIGLPDSYLSKNDGQWGITKRGPSMPDQQQGSAMGGMSPGQSLLHTALSMGAPPHSSISQRIIQQILSQS